MDKEQTGSCLKMLTNVDGHDLSYCSSVGEARMKAISLGVLVEFDFIVNPLIADTEDSLEEKRDCLFIEAIWSQPVNWSRPMDCLCKSIPIKENKMTLSELSDAINAKADEVDAHLMACKKLNCNPVAQHFAGVSTGSEIETMIDEAERDHVALLQAANLVDGITCVRGNK